MPSMKDGPSSGNFRPLTLRGNKELSQLRGAGVSKTMADNAGRAHSGSCVAWGIPFKVGKVVLVKNRPVTVKLPATKTQWLVFMHTSDVKATKPNADGFYPATKGTGLLGEHAADYVMVYSDGSEVRVAVRQRHQIGMVSRAWGENCFEAVTAGKPCSKRSEPSDVNPNAEWGRLQTRANSRDAPPWGNWLWAWENPHPRKTIVGVRFEPVDGPLVISAISAGKASANPLRWLGRRKAVLRLPAGKKFNFALDDNGEYKQIALDMGQVISAVPRPIYPNQTWARTYNNRVPEMSDREAIVEYAAHGDAAFHLPGGRTVPVARLEADRKAGPLTPVPPATQKVLVRTVQKGSRKPVAVKLHIHGQAGEYLPPNVNHRIPNPCWFQDYSVEFSHLGIHHCLYMPGEADVRLPLGKVYLEVSKGFEIKPVRKVISVTRATRKITVEIEKVLPWREAGWVTADTHVHFLSPTTALLEGAGEGVNVVNLLASQWGELMTNVGDFDGRTTHGAKQAGGDGEYLVRVGTENRQHVLGHISLLGYEGNIIGPMTTAGPGESAIGDPVELLMVEWARQCKKQGGVVIAPHHPGPRCENAAGIVTGDIDGVEMTAWGFLYGGINPYSLSDWYRYLNCGYMVAAVGGTDKMSATTAVGTVRTYAKIDPRRQFTYKAWMDAVRRAETFVTYGPLMAFAVEGKPAGTRMRMSRTGGTVDVTWKVASVTVPMSKVELVVNGEIRESRSVNKRADKGSFRVKVGKSCWIALLIRGHYADKPEIITAHSSPVMIELAGSPFLAAADAVTILEQIEGALAYLDTVGSRAETKRYKQMRLVLTSAQRSLHNRMHKLGRYHDHTPVNDHAEHH